MHQGCNQTGIKADQVEFSRGLFVKDTAHNEEKREK